MNASKVVVVGMIAAGDSSLGTDRSRQLLRWEPADCWRPLRARTPWNLARLRELGRVGKRCSVVGL